MISIYLWNTEGMTDRNMEILEQAGVQLHHLPVVGRARLHIDARDGCDFGAHRHREQRAVGQANRVAHSVRELEGVGLCAAPARPREQD